MKFCADHWARLRAAIDDRGLSDLVASDGKRAAANLASDLQKGAALQTFDPLMSAHNDIWAHAMQQPSGMSVMYANEDGSERCPICWTRDKHAESCPGLPECALTSAGFEAWIEIAADRAKTEYSRLLTAAKANA